MRPGASWGHEESPNCGVPNDLSLGLQGTVLANSEAEQSDGKCNRKQTAEGEMLNAEC